MNGQNKGMSQSSGGQKRTWSKVNAWALSLGCVIGWGAFVMPGTTFLPVAGPVGTIIAMSIGAVLFLFISKNIGYMIEK